MQLFVEEDPKYREFYKNPEKTEPGLVRPRNTTEVKPEYDFV
jgi:hypothetical protein